MGHRDNKELEQHEHQQQQQQPKKKNMEEKKKTWIQTCTDKLKYTRNKNVRFIEKQKNYFGLKETDSRSF